LALNSALCCWRSVDMFVVSVNVDFYWLPPYLNLLSSFRGPL
jgi:hypothetical protein